MLGAESEDSLFLAKRLKVQAFFLSIDTGRFSGNLLSSTVAFLTLSGMAEDPNSLPSENVDETEPKDEKRSLSEKLSHVGDRLQDAAKGTVTGMGKTLGTVGKTATGIGGAIASTALNAGKAAVSTAGTVGGAASHQAQKS
uniref:Uncharacterized protein n=1 Tax=Desertifilum tharense IPPAS B-1220 TaxID=1781255 RepID=A0ACD5GU32_9CYAN